MRRPEKNTNPMDSCIHTTQVSASTFNRQNAIVFEIIMLPPDRPLRAHSHSPYFARAIVCVCVCTSVTMCELFPHHAKRGAVKESLTGPRMHASLFKRH